MHDASSKHERERRPCGRRPPSSSEERGRTPGEIGERRRRDNAVHRGNGDGDAAFDQRHLGHRSRGTGGELRAHEALAALGRRGLLWILLLRKRLGRVAEGVQSRRLLAGHEGQGEPERETEAAKCFHQNRKLTPARADQSAVSWTPRTHWYTGTCTNAYAWTSRLMFHETPGLTKSACWPLSSGSALAPLSWPFHTALAWIMRPMFEFTA